MAVEGPGYPPHPPLSHPGWWRNPRVWWAALAICVLLILVSAILHWARAGGAQPGANGVLGASASSAAASSPNGTGGGSGPSAGGAAGSAGGAGGSGGGGGGGG